MKADSELTNLINGIRKERDLSPLTRNDRLDTAAEQHAAYMLQNRILSHSGRNNSSFDERIRNEGYAFTRAAENVAFGSRSAKSVLDLWMADPPHRDNILNPFATEIGVGAAPTLDNKNGDEETYWSLSLAAPLSSSPEERREDNSRVLEAEPVPDTPSSSQQKEGITG